MPVPAALPGPLRDPAPMLQHTLAQWERQGLGPFRFYRAEALTAAFADLDPGEAGDHAATIEASLAGEQLSAVAAWQAYRSGARIGHTYVVLQSGLG